MMVSLTDGGLHVHVIHVVVWYYGISFLVSIDKGGSTVIHIHCHSYATWLTCTQNSVV